MSRLVRYLRPGHRCLVWGLEVEPCLTLAQAGCRLMLADPDPARVERVRSGLFHQGLRPCVMGAQTALLGLPEDYYEAGLLTRHYEPGFARALADDSLVVVLVSQPLPDRFQAVAAEESFAVWRRRRR